MRKLFDLIKISLLSMPYVALGHPVAYEGSTSVMGWFQGEDAEMTSIYSVSHKLGLGLQYDRKKQETKPGFDQQGYFRVNGLIKRWNNPDSQANIYVNTGLGYGTFEGKESTAYLAGFQADAESRRLYTNLMYHATGPTEGFQKPDHHTTYRVGIAPYLAEYEELNTWFIVQTDHHSTNPNKVTITPLLRFFYKTALWELGYSLDNQPLFTYMVHL